MGKITYHREVKSSDPIKQIKVSNAKGYFDLIVNKSANGKAIRISDRTGAMRVNVTLKEVDDLIESLKLVKARGVKVSVNDIAFDAA